MPDGNTVTSTYTCLLDLPNLTPDARQGHIFSQFPAGALLSIGVLYDCDCTAELDATLIHILREGSIVIHRTR